MSNCPWNDLDDAMESLITAAMGDAGDYTSLVLQHVEVVAVRDASEWTGYAINCQLPAVFVQNRIVPLTLGTHGDSAMHVDESLDYLLLAMTSGTKVTARQNAKTLAWRILEAIKVARGVSVVINSVSRDFQFVPSAAEIGIVSRDDSNADSYFGWGAVSVQLRGSF